MDQNRQFIDFSCNFHCHKSAKTISFLSRSVDRNVRKLQSTPCVAVVAAKTEIDCQDGEVINPLKENTQLAIASSPAKAAGTWLLIGALGAGMRAFAEMLLDAGEMVVGTDQELATGEAVCSRNTPHANLKLIPPNSIDRFLRSPPKHVVFSNAVAESSPLLQQCRSRNLNPIPLPQALSQFLKSHDQVCVAGTHGKTTTSGMTCSILQDAGCHPSAYVGGVMKNHMRSGIHGSGRTAVLESCEYRQSFLHLSPKIIVLTGIESDHFDCFSSDAVCNQTFIDFVSRLPMDGTLIYNGDCMRSAAIAARCGRRTVSFSLRGNAEWNAISVDGESRAAPPNPVRPIEHQMFQLRSKTSDLGHVRLQVPGLHNRQNAVAAIAAAVESGVSIKNAIRGIGTFSGIQRRFEHRGNWLGIDWIDDYAHHPTAIQRTLETARSVFPNRRIIAVFEPHQLSRLSALFNDFRLALLLADECLILPVFPAREIASEAHCRRISGTLVRSISESGGRAFLMTNLDQVLGRLDHSGRPGDVVITMGAGRTHQIHDEIHRRLQRNSAA